ncbi:MAG: ferric reductase-like transmembrane domain-containing protein [Hoeflea sp.]|uniref:ferric reductase-like transmembrane domain-containing protein n=1 Tax=Hoeflea sp. TaxID=1940281 RepID=UPI00273090B3|nr:ferric reductase-like transmembrane domain-containing protein [Hoeflea sp.]MDP2120025.1 ferric reductase-like transmembrane domain-containing protein [Hoeflea sp.]
MQVKPPGRGRAVLIWGAVAAAVAIPIAAAALSPLLQWRDPVYIGAGFAGILALALLLFQPLLASGVLPGLEAPRGRRIHRVTGALLVMFAIIHVAALFVTSPPDVIDALTFASPTPFSVWGVVAMWALFLSALLAIFRRRVSPIAWRRAHTALAVVIVTGTVVHAWLITGTMETLSKAALCALVVAATFKALVDLRVWRRSRR